MNVIEQLFSGSDASKSNRWQLLRPSAGQVLPVRVPFDIVEGPVDPAIQAYAMQLHSDARRYLELRRLSCRGDVPDQWSLRLLEAMLLLEQARPDDSWHQLQLGLAWRQQREEEATANESLAAISITEWLLMATIALGAEEIDRAEIYASEAVGCIEDSPVSCLAEVLHDTRGDAMTVFAAVRLGQHRLQEAELLLGLAHDAHVQAGDMQQIAVDLILQSDVELCSGDRDAATFLLFEAERILQQECDTTRHLRCESLQQAIRNRLVDVHAPRRHRAAYRLSLN